MNEETIRNATSWLNQCEMNQTEAGITFRPTQAVTGHEKEISAGLSEMGMNARPDKGQFTLNLRAVKALEAYGLEASRAYGLGDIKWRDTVTRNGSGRSLP